MEALEIIGMPQSNFVRAVRMLCAEKNVPYRLVQERPHTPQIVAIHPLGKMPVMRHGDFTLFESKAIANYIDRTFPGPKLFPEDARASARIEQWVSVVNSALQPALSGYLRQYFMPEITGAPRDQSAIDAAWPAAREAMGVLDRAVAAGNPAGEDYTYADMNLMTVLALLRMPPESAQAFDALISLRAYYERHAQRPSFIATIPPPFSAMRN